MASQRPAGPPLPAHPELRQIAIAMEDAGISGEVLDAEWRIVFISSEEARIVGVSPQDVERFYGKSLLTRQLEDGDVWGITDEVSRGWWATNVPIMRHYLNPGDEVFETVFGPLAGRAAAVEPLAEPPRAWQNSYAFPPELQLRRTVVGDVAFIDMRLNDDEGRFIGVARQSRSTLPDALLSRLGRGDRGLFERMDSVSEPGRRPAAILFADLEASSLLSRRLPSRGYFELVRSLTDLIDSAVIGNTGIVGKHAGDGGSALFLTSDFGGSESGAARAAIEAARAISAGAGALGPDDVDAKLNIGLHWGATLMVGQVATSGRLEVTALGDQMNEAARIEGAAREGAILSSKDLIERLDPADAAATGVDPETIAYTPLSELEGAGEKAVRDAGSIPVARI